MRHRRAIEHSRTPHARSTRNDHRSRNKVEYALMKQVDLNCLTERHLLLFGAIIQWFARYELVMQEIIAMLIGVDSGSVMILTRGFDFGEKRQALFDLLRHRNVPLDRYDEINKFLMVPHTLTPLRNDIAHSGWVAGPSSGGIQPDWVLRLPPSVKPLHGYGLVEREEDKITYSIDEFVEIIETLAGNYNDFISYLHEIGLVRK
jgi:hypothetical protein